MCACDTSSSESVEVSVIIYFFCNSTLCIGILIAAQCLDTLPVWITSIKDLHGAPFSVSESMR